MDFVVSPSDLEKYAAVASAIDTNPVRILGRVAGLGEAEIKAGVPPWAWVLIAFGTGAAVGFVASPKLRRKFGIFRE